MNERRAVPGRRSDDQWSVWDKRVRDGLIFVMGIIGCAHELFILPDPRPSALVFVASLLGLPFVLSADESRNKRKDNDDE
jgi:hypothetical protein